jgi:hypothetical protein
MPKTAKTRNSNGKPRFYYVTHPWESRHHSDHSEIVAYVEASGARETVLDVRQTSGASHEAMAASILALIREHQEKRNALHDAVEALELVIADGLTYSSEHLAERAVTNIKKLMS